MTPGVGYFYFLTFIVTHSAPNVQKSQFKSSLDVTNDCWDREIPYESHPCIHIESHPHHIIYIAITSYCWWLQSRYWNWSQCRRIGTSTRDLDHWTHPTMCITNPSYIPTPTHTTHNTAGSWRHKSLRWYSCKLFRGHIECIDSNDDDGGLMYTVVYEDGDGDKEDLDPQECEEVVTLSDDVTI